MTVVSKVAVDHQRKDRRRAKGLVAAVASVPLLVLPATGSAAAATAPVSKASATAISEVVTLGLIPGGPEDLITAECAEQTECVRVRYTYLDLEDAVASLDDALRASAFEQQMVFGHSQGAKVAAQWLETYAGTEGAPSPSSLSFLLIGNPGRKYGGSRVSLGEMTPDTEYNVLDVSRQYDLAADTPDDKRNLLAMINAYVGFSTVHPHYEEVDIYDPANYVWKEGNTTYVFVPTTRLPILSFLYNIGLSDLADSLDAPLRAAIEKGYDRSYLPAQPGVWPDDAEPEAANLSAESEQPGATASALAVSPSASAEDRNDTADPVDEVSDTRQFSSTRQDSEPPTADDGVDVDLEDDGTSQTGDLVAEAPLDAETPESGVDQDQGAADAASGSVESASPNQSPSEDSSPSDETSTGSQGSPDSEASASNDE